MNTSSDELPQDAQAPNDPPPPAGKLLDVPQSSKIDAMMDDLLGSMNRLATDEDRRKEVAKLLV